MTWVALMWFIPDTALPLILIGATVALLTGAKRLAASLVGLAMTIIVIPLFVDSWLDAMPNWVLLIVIAGLLLTTLYGIAALLIGRKNIMLLFQQWKARLRLRLLLGTLRLPFRIIHAFCRILYRGLRHGHSP